MTVQTRLSLEDLAVGDEFRSGEHALDEAQIIEYARAFDPQPFHLDASEAESSFFGGLAASGWHTASITMRLLVDSVPIGNGVIGAGGEIAWPRPTRPTDVLHVVSTIREISPSRSRRDRGIVTMECLTLNQDGETCQRFVPKLVVLRRGEDA
ncbi:MAG: MaoC family dehydratase [Brachybacterium sp.]|uniref:MaoC family dehydratase n=1 Tax=Brachybacterium sp. TaxID=1891286 RepID=UPI0026499166|nr:MaoC family dehydratase [Brachybacterium sp.]MDN5687413.1 MaoC family dehydratase [Brachybacterium sp.]